MKKLSTSKVVKSNELINASYSLSLNEQRILLCCVAQINSTESLPKDNTFKVHVHEIACLVGDDHKGSLYKYIKEASQSLFDRTIRIKNSESVVELRWIYKKAQYFDQEGCVEITFSPDIIPYLSAISARFTQYHLKDVTQFKSTYAIRLYELLMQWQSLGTREISVTDLRELFCLQNKYPKIAELRRNVIDKAITDINKFSNLQVDVKTRKRGKTIVAFKFAYETKNTLGINQVKNQVEKTYYGYTKTEIDKIAKPGETYFQAGSRLHKLALENDTK